MNKLMIPAILGAVVLVAAAFALMPVQKASTVHTGLNTDLQAFFDRFCDVEDDGTGDGADNDNAEWDDVQRNCVTLED